jgi:hypothetical protein
MKITRIYYRYYYWAGGLIGDDFENDSQKRLLRKELV